MSVDEEKDIGETVVDRETGQGFTPGRPDPRIGQPKAIKVGVFPNDEGSSGYRAYTRWYNPQWPGCCEHQVEAVNGTEAKKQAIAEHKEHCVE